ncbi:HXXEE domain-containing protein [Mycobacterium sp.]|uniref:HXXEE domain-containing protein n=1 Tax=Mycobacterium sp. TaxID=1785 RepID=UPI003C796F9C
MSCPLAPSFFVAVNVPFVWFVLPIAALLCRHNRAVGLTGAGLLFTNALSHIIGAVTPMGYSPGTLTAAVIFIPLSVWVFATCFGPGKLCYQTLAAILIASVLAQVILLWLLLGLSHNAIALPTAIAIQTIDPLLLLIVPWAANRIWPPGHRGTLPGGRGTACHRASPATSTRARVVTSSTATCASARARRCLRVRARRRRRPHELRGRLYVPIGNLIRDL